METVDSHRTEDAVHDALQAFWGVIAEKFPEVASGDFDMGATFEMHEKAEGWVRSWLFWNGKGE